MLNKIIPITYMVCAYLRDLKIGKLLVKNHSEKWVGLGEYHVLFVFVVVACSVVCLFV